MAKHGHKMISHRGYFIVFFGLMLFAALSFAMSFVHLGVATVPVAMSISMVKALLVVMFFMELVEQRFVNRFVLVAAAAFVLLLMGLMVADVLTRDVPTLLAPG